MKTHRLLIKVFVTLALLLWYQPVIAGNAISQAKCDEITSHIPPHASGQQHNQAFHCNRDQEYNLTIALQGTGSGRVSSTPAGIFCETDCNEDYAAATQVVLTAQPYSGSVFSGWSGADCSGSATCNVVLDADTTVTASFALIPPAPLSLVTPYVNESDMREITDFFNAQYEPYPASWGRIHDGLDIYPVADHKAYQAACGGRVRTVYPFEAQVSVVIDCDSRYSIMYNFESQAPNTGQSQLDYMQVVEGQLVAQGDIIGYLYSAENPDRAHVHFSFFDNTTTVCPAPYFTQAAHDSVLNLVAVAHEDVVMCRSGNVLPPPLLAPFYLQSDMAKITAGYSSTYSLSPWDTVHDGFDIYPQGDLKPFQAACSGQVEQVQLNQPDPGADWQVLVTVVCDDYVYDPDQGGYFIPMTTRYLFETMSDSAVHGQHQLDNIAVVPGQVVTAGDLIGFLSTANEYSHLHFAYWQFDRLLFQQLYGISGIPRCPEAHFTAQAGAAMLNLLHVSWPGAALCYQN